MHIFMNGLLGFIYFYYVFPCTFVFDIYCIYSYSHLPVVFSVYSPYDTDVCVSFNLVRSAFPLTISGLD